MSTGDALAKSVLDRLKSVRAKTGEAPNDLLRRYAIEGLVWRLGATPHAERLVLKGATLFTAWTQRPHRATKDLDLLTSGSPEVDRVVDIVRDACGVDGAPRRDGLVFDPAQMHGARIRERAKYPGVRVEGSAKLGKAVIKVQVDFGFGDQLTSPPLPVSLPPILGHLPAVLPGYPRETVIAEKTEAMIDLGLHNSRVKDYYDVWYLADNFVFGAELGQALRATFERRGTPLPSAFPREIRSSFARSRSRQWAGFLKTVPEVHHLPFSTVVEAVGRFLDPLFDPAWTAALSHWPPGGPWSR